MSDSSQEEDIRDDRLSNIQEHRSNDGAQQQQNISISSSPASQSNSSTSRRQRIVELLQADVSSAGQQLTDWVIRAEFYNEDVARDSDTDGDDEEEDDISFDGEADRTSDENADDTDDDNLDHDDLDQDAIDDDFELAPDGDQTTSTESDDYDSDQAANYDTSLPVAHRYLGENLEESRGTRAFIEGSTVQLPLINLNSIVLFPGQVLPIKTANLNPRIEIYLRACITRDSTTIGIIYNPQSNKIGTTAEIRNYSMQGGAVESLIMAGRQRFELISAPFETAIEGDIKILPEIFLGHPYRHLSTLLRFHNCYNHTNNIANKFIISKHPYWLLRRYEARNVMDRILHQIKDWCSPADMTKDPNDFSYWVATNLPISNSERMKALSLSCTEARLIWLLDILEKSEVFECSSCKNIICYKKDVFPMSYSGPQCTFVNPNGYIHDTLTVRNAQGLIQDDGWTTPFSWFPGYKWRMAHCSICRRHIGWCYKHIEAETKPKRFFGLTRASVRLQSRVNPVEPESPMAIDTF